MLVFMMLIVQEDLEARERAFDALPFPALRRGLDDPAPVIRGRSSDVLHSFSPLAWVGRATRGLVLRSPAPEDAEDVSKYFLAEVQRFATKLHDVLAYAP